MTSEDKQELFVALDPDTKTVASVFDNAASVIYQGIEVEVQYVFNEYFRGFLNYGRLMRITTSLKRTSIRTMRKPSSKMQAS